MAFQLRRRDAIGLTAVGLTFGLVGAAHASQVLPVQNLTFSQYTGLAPKQNFSAVDPNNWYRGPTAPGGDLVFIDAPNTATVDVTTGGLDGYGVYGPFANPPPGGNFVQADGNPDYESEFKQDLTGLVGGQTYTLSFWQAAGQQQTFSGATTEQWLVYLGNSAVTVSCPPNPPGGICTVSDGTDLEQISTVMDTPSQGVSPWQQVTLSFTLAATAAADETLTFLAWGDGGSDVNLPPTVFLAGVNTPAQGSPEPASLSLLLAGLVGAGAARRKRTKRNAG